jgi:2-desacetyl-2-hydroxyethyl bacteriochlorophyllide A dehydrogenase
MSKGLLLVGPRDVRHYPYEDAPLGPDQVRAKAIVSGISHGTELNFYRGVSAFHSRRFDEKLRLFLEIGEYDLPPYPRPIGYEWVGRVAETGSAVDGLQVGDLVHLPFGHCETATFAPGASSMHGPIQPLPAGINPEQAAMLSLALTALQAVHDARIKVGDRVAIFGMGVIGLFAVQLARLAGASWIEAVDPHPPRRDLARRYGADRTLDPRACDSGREIKASSAAGADVAIEVSGRYAALHDAIRSVRVGGTVVAAGFYAGDPSTLRLGEEWHHNRVTMVSSMAFWDCPHRDHPAWDIGRLRDAAVELFLASRLQTEHMITHRFPFDEAQRAYDLIDNQREETIKVVLTY